MNIDVGSLRSMAPSLAIPPRRHYDPSDLEDAALRMEWAKFLFRAGYRLRYPQETTGTAVLLFHRFLIQEQVGKHRRLRDVILTTCLFLAGKVTEAPRRLRDVINVLHMLTRTGQDEPPLLDKTYWTMKERIVEFEQVLLRTINFQVDPPDPYRLLLNYARSLRLGRASTRTAWGLVNDSLFCPRALSAPPPAVACAAIRMARRVQGGDRRLRCFPPPLKKRKRGPNDSGGGGGGGGGGGDASDDRKQEAVVSRGDGDAENPVLLVAGGGGDASDDRKQEAVVSRGDGDAENPVLLVADGDVGARVGSGQEEADILRGKPSLSSSADGDRAGPASVGGGAAAADVSGGGDEVGKEGGDGDDNGDEPTTATTKPWWRLFDARDAEVELVCSELEALYRTHAKSSGTTNGVDGDIVSSGGTT